MLRKFILLAILSSVGKKLYHGWRASQMRTPFPTTRRPPEGYEG